MGMNGKAAVWKNGTATDLNTLVPADSPLYLLSAFSISDRGQIVGFGVTSSSELHAFMANRKGRAALGEATEAVVAPLSLTTSHSTAILDGSGSTNGSGKL